MTNRELLNIIEEIKRKEKTDLTEIASAVGKDRSYLSKLINAEEVKRLTKPLLRDFSKAFPAYFNPDNKNNGPPPAYIPVSWQDYVKLIHFSLEAIKAGQNEILLQQAKTRAEVRGYGKYHLVKDAKGKSERFDKLLAEVDKLVNEELSEDDTEDNPSGK